MRLLALELRSWRNFTACALEPGSSINVVWGGNAQGKTNLLEAIFYVATLRSFRSGRRSGLVTWGGSGFRIKARAQVEDRVATFEVGFVEGSQRLRVDGAAVASSEDYFGGFNVVLFTPEQLALVRGEPAGRRRFLDRALFNVDARQLGLVRRYNRLLRERNAWLKQAVRGGADALLVQAVESQLARSGAELVARRQELLEDISPTLARVHQELAGGGKALRVRYVARGISARASQMRCSTSVESWAELLEEELRQRRDLDVSRGFTGVGPHADDLVFLLDDRSARAIASQGEARTIVLSLKLAEVLWVTDRRTEAPVLLLDDMGSELDDRRREVLFDYIGRMSSQTFVTTVDHQRRWYDEKTKYFHIIDGRVAEGE